MATKVGRVWIVDEIEWDAIESARQNPPTSFAECDALRAQLTQTQIAREYWRAKHGEVSAELELYRQHGASYITGKKLGRIRAILDDTTGGDDGK